MVSRFNLGTEPGATDQDMDAIAIAQTASPRRMVNKPIRVKATPVKPAGGSMPTLTAPAHPSRGNGEWKEF